ncbi:MAG: hypothetical protein V7711_08425 [Pseudomonadales bacterium]
MKFNKIIFSAFVIVTLQACSPPDQTPPVNENSDKVAVLITGWGETLGYDREFRKQVRRSQTGAKKVHPFEACTEMYAGKWPFASQVGLLPFAIMHQLPILGAAFDSMGVYRLSEDGQEYVAIWDEAVRLKVTEIPDIEGLVIPVIESKLFAERSINGIDPRTGDNYLEGYFQIGIPSRERGKNPLAFPNGLGDAYEIGLAGSIADAAFMNEDLTPRVHPADEAMTATTISELKRLFGDEIAVEFGAYARTPGIHELEDDVALKLVKDGYTKLVLSRETTDNNNYANDFATKGFVYKALCDQGLADDVQIKQTRQVGRTPEYNAALLEVLRPHLDFLDKGSDVALIYTTYGLPFPGSKTSGPFAIAHPLAKEVYHENAYLNYQSFKRYAQAEFGSDYQLEFNHKGKTSDIRTDSYYAYAMFPSRFYGDKDDPLRFATIRQSIDQAKLDGRKNIVVLLSHWNYSNTDNMLAMRKLNHIPYNSREQVRRGEFSNQWCESADSFDVIPCHQEAAISLQFSEVFDKQAESFGQGYAQRIRGAVERFGMVPQGIDIVARASVTVSDGGSVSIDKGALKGASLDVAADPRPGWPESFEYDDYETFVDPADPFVGAWFDFEAYIAETSEIPDLEEGQRSVSPALVFGPYRTLVNKPARVSLPVDKTLLQEGRLLPVIFNHVTGGWDEVFDVAGGTLPVWDAQTGIYSFDTQVLGLMQVIQQ